MALGVFSNARVANSFCVTTNKPVSSCKLLIDVLVTGICKPALSTLSRKMEAPIAEEPIPASQAKIICWIAVDLAKASAVVVVSAAVLVAFFIAETCA